MIGHSKIVATDVDNLQFIDGNQAVALAAWDAHVDYVTHYPGSPLNRVIPVLQDIEENAPVINHALNEHIAALAALGASMSGARSLVVMKHVGLNIAADPLNYAGLVKISGGMVVVVGTDPGARTSTGEEDVHWYAPQFNYPLLEPYDVQSIYDTVQHAFDLSEQVRTPVLVFVAGRLAYQSVMIERRARLTRPAKFEFNKNKESLINVGQRAVRNHRQQIERITAYAAQPLRAFDEFNQHAAHGVITRGATYAVVHEVIRDLQLQPHIHLLNVERVYPVNPDYIIDWCRGKTAVTVIEDQDGFLETMLKRELFGKVACSIEGKNNFPAWGEINDQQVRQYFIAKFKLENPVTSLPALDKLQVPERPGTFCEGCPHRAAFYAIDHCFLLNDGIIGGDIGCSSLAPHRTDWLLCMNAGVGISQGIAQLLPHRALVSSGGEGSLFHGGLISLQSAVENNIKMTHILFDNASIAMTGHQDSPTTHGHVDVRMLLAAIGVQQVYEVNAFATTSVIDAINAAAELPGVKVVWVRGNCALLPSTEMLQRRQQRTLQIDNSRCGECSLCYDQLQCPAIIKNSATGNLSVNLHTCRRCTACLSVCPNNAINVIEQEQAVVHA